MKSLLAAMRQAEQDMGGMTPVSKEEMQWITDILS